MVGKNQPERWEATLLATTMAMAGAPFLFDKLGSLLRIGALSSSALQHSTPVMLVAVGAILLLAEQGEMSTHSASREIERGRHEL